MAGMSREEVIAGLNDIHGVASGLGGDQCYLNGIGIKQLQALIDGATELLKAQEPKVIPYNELDNYEVLWLEVRDVETEEGLAAWVKTAGGGFRPCFVTWDSPT